MPRLVSLAAIADSTTAPEELSEEDQQLKNELDMLVERLTVRIVVFQVMLALLTDTFLGVEEVPVQAGARGHEKFHKNVNFVHDRRPQAPQVPKTALRNVEEAV